MRADVQAFVEGAEHGVDIHRNPLFRGISGKFFFQRAQQFVFLDAVANPFEPHGRQRSVVIVLRARVKQAAVPRREVGFRIHVLPVVGIGDAPVQVAGDIVIALHPAHHAGGERIGIDVISRLRIRGDVRRVPPHFLNAVLLRGGVKRIAEFRFENVRLGAPDARVDEQFALVGRGVFRIVRRGGQKGILFGEGIDDGYIPYRLRGGFGAVETGDVAGVLFRIRQHFLRGAFQRAFQVVVGGNIRRPASVQIGFVPVFDDEFGKIIFAVFTRLRQREHLLPCHSHARHAAVAPRGGGQAVGGNLGIVVIFFDRLDEIGNVLITFDGNVVGVDAVFEQEVVILALHFHRGIEFAVVERIIVPHEKE